MYNIIQYYAVFLEIIFKYLIRVREVDVKGSFLTV